MRKFKDFFDDMKIGQIIFSICMILGNALFVLGVILGK